MNEVSLGENLSRLIEINRTTKTKVAQTLGVNFESVRGWCTGRNYPNMISLLRLCEIFDVTPNQMLGFDDFPKAEVLKEAENKLAVLQDKLDILSESMLDVCDSVVYAQKQIAKLKGE